MLLRESTAKITNQFVSLLLLFNARLIGSKLKKSEESFCKLQFSCSVTNCIFSKAQKSSNPTSVAKIRPRNASISSESSKKAPKKPKNLPENSPNLPNPPQAKPRVELPPQIQSILSQPEPVAVTVPPSTSASPIIHFPEIGKAENLDCEKNTDSNKAVNQR
jgi:hypothetical protein